MKRLLCTLLIHCLIGLSCLSQAWAQVQSADNTTFSQAELDQLLAPIALYPDPLLGQVLTASTYPLEVVQAARYIQQNPGLAGDSLAQAVAGQPWDASVKSLTLFPSVLTMMDDQLEWTQKLGDAFLAQEGAVMNTVQALRTRAQATGSLGNSPQQTIQIQDGAIDINPASQDTVYVPYYDPNIVYGTWWWPAYPPFLWTPPPYYGYVPAGGIAFGTGIAINNPLFMYSRPNWPGHNIVNYPGGNYSGLPSRPARGRPTWTWPHATGTVWNHNPAHRAGVGYRDAATRNRYQPLWNGGSDNETRQERAAVQPSSNLAGTQQRQYPQPTPTPLPHAQATGYPQPSYPVPATAPPVESNHATRTAPPQGQPEHGHNQSAPSAASPRPAEREPEAR